MAARRTTSERGLQLIKRYEGFRPQATEHPRGGWVIGYSHVDAAREGLRITETDAELLLRGHDLPPVERFVSQTVLAPLTQNEFDALVSFVFNVGQDAFLESEVLARLNAGEKLAAAEAMAAWRRTRIGGSLIVADTLVRRRAVERALFLEQRGGPIPASSALFPAELDLVATSAAPSETPAALEEPASGAAPAAEAPPLDENAPERAARDVGARLARILGDGPPAQVSDEASVEEITEAVSRLAAAHAAPETSETSDSSDQSEARVIDDLEIPEELRDEAALKAAVEASASMRPAMNFAWAPFAALAALGAILAGWGVFDWSKALSGPSRGGGELLAGPYLSVLGALLLATMGYYMLRTFHEREA